MLNYHMEIWTGNLAPFQQTWISGDPLSAVSVMVSLWVFLSSHHCLPLVGGKNKNKKRKKKSYIAVIGFLQLLLKNWFSVSQQATDGAYMSLCPLQ